MPAQQEFNLKFESDALQETLKKLSGSHNIVQFNIDEKLPFQFEGDPSSMVNAIKTIALALAENLINGIIQIELHLKERMAKDIFLLVRIVGKGFPDSKSPRYKPMEKIQEEVQLLLPGLQSKWIEGSNMMVTEFSKSFRLAPEKSKDTAIFNNKRILIAEDNAVNVIVFSSFLDDWKIQNTVAKDGFEAVELAKADRYDAILMDIHMPVMNGIEAIKEIRRLGINIPIIVLSAISYKDEIDLALKSGANEFLKKPIASWELYALLQKLL